MAPSENKWNTPDKLICDELPVVIERNPLLLDRPQIGLSEITQELLLHATLRLDPAG